ncbi:MAG TPA: hypothetical protein VFF64_00460 [Candidatus Eremiobacteraceae bacterium]|nr:hypothetical protein [Candidatus Eremiobacteraceae bacterium]
MSVTTYQARLLFGQFVMNRDVSEAENIPEEMLKSIRDAVEQHAGWQIQFIEVTGTYEKYKVSQFPHGGRTSNMRT